MLPSPPTRRPPSFFQDVAGRLALGLSGALVALGGLAVLFAGGAVAAAGASLLVLGGLGLTTYGLGLIAERRRLDRPIPLDPDSMRISRPPREP
jgi:hypothetical protein